MKYMGSKLRFAKDIIPFLLKNKKENQWYVEPFCGGCNIIDKISGKRIANDKNYYLIELWKALQSGWIPPERISKLEHKNIRENKDKYDACLVGWVGFACSYSGVFFGGYAGDYPISRRRKDGSIPNYQDETFNTLLKQKELLKGCLFYNKNYWELDIPKNSIVYCDPPYANVSNYKTGDFDSNKFWQWCEQKTNEENYVYVSEYNAPDNWKCIWEKDVISQLSANGKSGGNKNSVEKLFILK
jgi:DNA adenine methylase